MGPLVGQGAQQLFEELSVSDQDDEEGSVLVHGGRPGPDVPGQVADCVEGVEDSHPELVFVLEESALAELWQPGHGDALGQGEEVERAVQSGLRAKNVAADGNVDDLTSDCVIDLDAQCVCLLPAELCQGVRGLWQANTLATLAVPAQEDLDLDVDHGRVKGAGGEGLRVGIEEEERRHNQLLLL